MKTMYSEEQIRKMIEKIKKIKPEQATRERAIKILNMLPEVAEDITKALKQLAKESEKKLSN
jgi:DNA-directed RNA polymerase subunit F